MKAKGERQKARGKVGDAPRAKARLLFLTFAFCLLPFAFTTAFTQEGRTRPRKVTAAPAQPLQEIGARRATGVAGECRAEERGGGRAGVSFADPGAEFAGG